MPRGRGPSSPSRHPPINDDLLSEILIRLPPQPSSLPRASLVCKRWRRLVSDPAFLRRFRAHHRKPPILGFFASDSRNITFTPTPDPPDRIPTARFSSRLDDWEILSCRHGRVLVLNRTPLQLLVWDPVTGDRRSLDVPLEFDKDMVVFNGSVLCAAADQGHVHGGCHSSPFKVVLAGTGMKPAQVFACVYSSETGIWSDIISTVAPYVVPFSRRSNLIENSIYCLLHGIDRVGILEFDLDKQTLAVTDVPAEVYVNSNSCSLFAPQEGGGLGLVVLSEFRGQLWNMKFDCDGVAPWVPGKTIELDKLLFLGYPRVIVPPSLVGLDEDHNVMFLWSVFGMFMVQLESMQFKQISKRMPWYHTNPFTSLYPSQGAYCCHPFTNFYAPGTGIGGRYDGAQLLHNT